MLFIKKLHCLELCCCFVDYINFSYGRFGYA